MNGDSGKVKKALCVALIALIIAFLAFASVESPDIAFEIVGNNTDLGATNGSGERLVGTVYYTNTSAIELAVIGKVISDGVEAEYEMSLLVNNTAVKKTSFESISSPGTIVSSDISFIIPKNSNYSVTASPAFDFVEWREYPILSGKNGTLSVNQTISTNVQNSTGKARMLLNNQQNSLINNSWNRVQLNKTMFDIGSQWNSALFQYNVTNQGYYEISGAIGYGGFASGNLLASGIWINDNIYSVNTINASADIGIISSQVQETDLVYLSPGDNVTLKYFVYSVPNNPGLFIYSQPWVTHISLHKLS